MERTDRTRLRRKADRGHHDRVTVDAILDAGLFCHVGFAVDGHPWVFPTAYARIDDHLYLHGAAANFALRTLASGAEACVTVTIADGLVLARSAFHHSVNYRSVMVFARGEAVDDPSEKRRGLMAIVEHLVPGRSVDTRAPTDAELRATLVVRLPIVEASAKIRTGGPLDDPEDLELAHWAGELPLQVVALDPVPDNARPEPAYVRAWGAQPAR